MTKERATHLLSGREAADLLVAAHLLKRNWENHPRYKDDGRWIEKDEIQCGSSFKVKIKNKK